mmetsp:Transcript_16958/g.42033  ORF Transcript_16958/g.42033 Transcript_16958/m.42033 type:complete len:2141 (+) Transcript_16958:416-6838(+)|eukprot:CAMPEP_0179004204 /NCGR_PEP_ID=MMETSP0795-20121207/13150_1 /TAXON_ID=88552 /ORGANISM="Amoebophrya sp., Strain Ameob2" /LENGTH=2140 /DNA_ID=CAMNT_0020698391 /DNA_START=412 /DNA_END=6834 /DNA_ORIENTATION=-
MELATHLDKVALGFITPQEEAQLLVDGRGFICGVSNGFRALFGGGGSPRDSDFDLTGWDFRDVFRDPVSEQLEWAPWVQDVAQREEKLVATISDARGCKKWVSCMRILGTRKLEKQDEKAPGSRNEIWCIVRARSVWMGGVRFAILSLHHVPETRLALAEVLCDCEALTKGVITGADLNNWLDEMALVTTSEGDPSATEGRNRSASDQEGCEFELSGAPWAKKSWDESTANANAHPQPRKKVVDDAPPPEPSPAAGVEEEDGQSLQDERPQNPASLGRRFMKGGSSENDLLLNMNATSTRSCGSVFHHLSTTSSIGSSPKTSASSTLAEAERVALQRVLERTHTLNRQADGASQNSSVEIARLAFLHGLRAAVVEQAKNEVGARTAPNKAVMNRLLRSHFPGHAQGLPASSGLFSGRGSSGASGSGSQTIPGRFSGHSHRSSGRKMSPTQVAAAATKMLGELKENEASATTPEVPLSATNSKTNEEEEDDANPLLQTRDSAGASLPLPAAHHRSRKQRKVSVVLLPEHTSPQHDVQNSIVVLIQHVVVSAAVTALGCGASAVQLCGSVYSLRQVAASLDAKNVVKCGVTPEGQTLAGFDKGVDAKSFAEDLLGEEMKNGKSCEKKSVLLYTTNGTRAIPWVQDARRVVLGSLLNASAVVSSLLECQEMIQGGGTSASTTAAGTEVEDEGARLPIVFVCCGYNRGQHRSMEDELIAAYLLFLLMQSCSNPSELLLDDAARLVLQQVDTRTEQSLVTDLKRRFGKGPTTVAHGRERLTNVDFLLQLDLYANTLPVYCPLLGAFLRQHQSVFIERAEQQETSDFEPGAALQLNQASGVGGDQGFFNARKQISSMAKSRAIGAWPKQRAGSPKRVVSTDGEREAAGEAAAAGRAVVEKAEARVEVEVLETGMQSDQHTPVTARTSSRHVDHAVRADLTNANPGVLVTGAAASLQCSVAFPILLGGEGEGDATAPSGQHATDADDNPTSDPHSQRTRLLHSRYSTCLRQRQGSFGTIFPQSRQQHRIADQFGSLDQSINLKKVRLFAVRHGDYEKSIAKSMVGHLNPTLSDAGRDEAAALASWLADQEKFALVICSPLLRAAMTAELIAAEQQNPLSPQIDSDLTAIDRGDWSGLLLSEIHRFFPGEWAAWCEDPYWDAHGGEAYVDIMLRVRQSLLKILRRCMMYANEFADRESGTANVCVVTHCSIVCSLIGLVAGLSQRETVPLAERLKPSSVTLIEVDVLPSGKMNAEFSESREPAFVGDVKYVGKTVADFNDGAVRALVEEEMSTLGFLGTTLGLGAGSTVNGATGTWPCRSRSGERASSKTSRSRSRAENGKSNLRGSSVDALMREEREARDGTSVSYNKRVGLEDVKFEESSFPPMSPAAALSPMAGSFAAKKASSSQGSLQKQGPKKRQPRAVSPSSSSQDPENIGTNRKADPALIERQISEQAQRYLPAEVLLAPLDVMAADSLQPPNIGRQDVSRDKENQAPSAGRPLTAFGPAPPMEEENTGAQGDMNSRSSRGPSDTTSYLSPSAGSLVLANSWVSIVRLPRNVAPKHYLSESLVVLIDALRMSSTVVTAMGEGLNSCRLFSSVAAIKHASKQYLPGDCLLGGELKRALMPGFDRDNSPLSYLDSSNEGTLPGGQRSGRARAQRGADRIGLFLTTNGTRALPWVKRAKFLVLGSFLNLSAVVRFIMQHAGRVRSILFVCSGQDRGLKESVDDEMCAAYLLKAFLAEMPKSSTKFMLDGESTSLLRKTGAVHAPTSVSGKANLGNAGEVRGTSNWSRFSSNFAETHAAIELKKLGLGSDVSFCLQRDRYADVLPLYLREKDIFLNYRVHSNLRLQLSSEVGRSDENGHNTPNAPDEVVLLDSPKSSVAVSRDEDSSEHLHDLKNVKKVKIYVVALRAKQIIGSLDPAPSVDVLQTSTELAEQFSQLSRQELEAAPKPPRSLVASSPLRRARVVAERIAAELDALPIVLNELTAQDAGDWTGLTEAEVELFFPNQLQKWAQEPRWQGHGGESAEQVTGRARDAVMQLLNSHVLDENLNRNLLDAIVLVTHDTFANALLAGCGGTVGEKAADQSDPAGVSVSILNYDPGPQLRARRGGAADNSWNSFAKNLELEARKLPRLPAGSGPEASEETSQV